MTRRYNSHFSPMNHPELNSSPLLNNSERLNYARPSITHLKSNSSSCQSVLDQNNDSFNNLNASDYQIDVDAKSNALENLISKKQHE
jgi:hypothetical protein